MEHLSRKRSPSEERKAEEIRVLLLSSEPAKVDLQQKLREMTITAGGLVTDSLRRKAWPVLVGLQKEEEASKETAVLPSKDVVAPSPDSPPSSFVLRDFNGRCCSSSVPKSSDGCAAAVSGLRLVARSEDFEQIEHDAARCTCHLLTPEQRMQRRILGVHDKQHGRIARLLKRRQRHLSNLVNSALSQSDCTSRVNKSRVNKSQGEEEEQRMHYYQGYHDVASIFLSTFFGYTDQQYCTSRDCHTAEQVLFLASQSHFADCLKTDFSNVMSALRLVLFPLMSALDTQVHDYLSRCRTEPYFAFSWVITWFSHDICDTDTVKRLFDVFLASHPLMPIYVSVAMVLHPINRRTILNTHCDFASVHETLRSLPKNTTTTMASWKDEQQLGGSYVSNGKGREFDSDNLSSSSLSDSSEYQVPAYVPIQDLIDTAVQYMDQFPPDKILRLASQYYYRRKRAGSLLRRVPEIDLFQQQQQQQQFPQTTNSEQWERPAAAHDPATIKTGSWFQKMKRYRKRHREEEQENDNIASQ